jgi:hypothetical protein
MDFELISAAFVQLPGPHQPEYKYLLVILHFLVPRPRSRILGLL